VHGLRPRQDDSVSVDTARTPYDPIPRQRWRGSALAEWAHELAEMASPPHLLRSRAQAS
jgi:hypothetical protein